MKRTIYRGCVRIEGKTLYAPALELFHGVTAEIDLGGDRPVAWVDGEAIELSVQA